MNTIFPGNAVNYFNPDGSNGDTTQESEEGEDTGESICSDGGDSISLPFNGGPQVLLDPLDDDELRHALMSIDTDLCLEDSIGQIIDILNE